MGPSPTRLARCLGSVFALPPPAFTSDCGTGIARVRSNLQAFRTGWRRRCAGISDLGPSRLEEPSRRSDACRMVSQGYAVVFRLGSLERRIGREAAPEARVEEPKSLYDRIVGEVTSGASFRVSVESPTHESVVVGCVLSDLA
jgi:hypothetical protein